MTGERMADRAGMAFRRDQLTWTAYVMLAWFAYLQAAPGLVIAHLREELDLSYSVGGLHVAAFAVPSSLVPVKMSCCSGCASGAGGLPPR